MMFIMHAEHVEKTNYCTVTGVVHRRGFTLIELLVVIAIIALLLSIMVPALGRVKDKARQLVCKTGLRQLGLATTIYVNMYNRYPSRQLIPARFLGDPDFYDWDLWFGSNNTWNITWEAVLTKANCLPEVGQRASGDEANMRKKIWMCPSQKHHPLMTSPPWHDFGINGMLGDKLRTEAGWLAGRIRQDSRKLLIAEVDPYYGEFPNTMLTAPYVDPTLIYYRHRGQSNVLFMDGHVGHVDKKTQGIDNAYGGLWNVRKDIAYK